MNILISANDRYVMPLTVLLASLFETQSEPMDFYFLRASFSEENSRFLRQYAEENGAGLHFLEVGEEAFRGLPTKSYISRETYFRLLAAELLPGDMDRILWLDADMCAHRDIASFYHRDLAGCAVAACPHGAVMKPTMLENCERIGIAHPEQYFNAGVMLCNLEKWRRMDIPGKMREILSVPRAMKFPGQDLTNLLFNGEVQTCDWREYNCMTHSILPEEMETLREMARLIHFAGFAKPWTFHDLPFADVWKHYYLRSPFRDAPLRTTSYFGMKAVYRRFYEKTENNGKQEADNA